MPGLTAEEAVQLLKSDPTKYATPEALRNLASQVSVESTGKVTVLYSGKVGGIDTNDIVKAMIAQGEDIRVINKTPAATFLDSKTYQEAVAKAFNTTIDAVQTHDFLYDAKNGVWAETSSRFVAGSTGDVRVINPFGDTSRTLAQVEIPKLLGEPAVKSINGIPKEIFQSIYNKTGSLAEVSKAVSASSSELVGGIGLTKTGDTITKVNSESLFKGTAYEGTKIPAGELNVSLKVNMNQALTPNSATTLAEGWKNLGLGAKVVGFTEATAKGIGVLGLALTAYRVYDMVDRAQIAYDQGDKDGAAKILTNESLQIGGGFAAGLATAELAAGFLSPLLVGGPVGDVAYIVLVGAAGLAGGFFGEQAIKSLLDNPPNFDALKNWAEKGLDAIGSLAKGLLSEIFDPLNDLITSLQNSFNQAEITRSPIILDLDGNGVETINKSAGIHFDLDGNKFAETTGWVGKNDGLLVLDKNGNGTIDNGSELFGNNTLLNDGSKAANGFAALVELDSNKDGKVDISDSAYTQLRLWKDSNSDGQVNLGELLTLNQAGVKSLNTGFTAQTQTDAEGNQHLQVGSYTYTDGSTRSMDDVWFATDTARTIDQSLVTVNTSIAALPEVQGFGNVHSLQQAMAQDTSGKLQSLVTQFGQTTDAKVRQGLMNELLYRWAGVQDVDPNSRAATQIYGNAIGDARKLATLEAFLGQGYLGTWCWGTRDPNPHGQAAPILLRAFDLLSSYVYSQLMQQTQYKPLLESIKVNVSDSGVTVDVTQLASILRTQYNANTDQGAVYLGDFATSLKTIGTFGTEVISNLRKLGNANATGFDFLLATLGFNSLIGTAGNDYLTGSDSDDVIDGLAGNDNISAGDGKNSVKGGLGDDIITAQAGNDLIDGGDGNDNIEGGTGNNNLQGGAGNDIISGAGTLTGGTGNDVLTGYNGTTDTFIFNVGDGADTISTYESSGIASDVLKFGVGITAASLKLERSGYDLIFKIGSNGDQVRVSNWYYGAYYQLAKLEFADATVLTNAQISQLSVSQTGTAANDYLYGSASNDLIDGLAGNDNISAGDGNNTVKGGLGDDYITAGVGNDSVDGGDGNDNIQGGAGTNTLQGGIGNDTISGAGTLTGGTGNDVLTGYNGTTDTFIFNVGDGADTISTYESSGIASDVLKFGVGITAASLKLERSGYDLIFKIGSNGDQVRVSNWYYGAYYQLAKLEFADATVLTNAQISQLSVSQTGTAANDYLYGSASNDLIDGLAGNDNISAGDGNNTVKGGLGDDYITAGVGNDSVDGGDGNDNIQGGAGTNTLQGGIGNDTISGAGTLTGGTGNDVLTGYNGTTDTFIFNVGDGADTISTYESSGIASDVLKFGVGITAASLKLERSGYDLIFKIGSNGDQVRVSNWYYGAYYQLAKLEFADATVLTNAQISQLSVSQTGTAANDYLYGSASNDLIDGLAGNDNISAGDGNNTVKGGLGDDYITAGVGNDSVDGGDGNDNIQGGAGTNTLQGGIGNDTISGAGTLTGGTGNDVLTGYNGTTDTFIFNVGDGADTISTYESSGIASDVLKFGVGITAASLKLERSGYDLIFKIGSNGDQVRVSNWYYGAYYQLAKLEFADATVLTNAQISQLSVSQTGTAANDYLYGSASNDLIDGLAGNDNISAGDGNNTVKGGLGDDYITAGVGNDSVDGGDGNDNIQGGAGTNTLQGGIGNDTISGAGTLTGGTGNDVLTGYNGTTDTFIFNVGDGADTISTYESSGIASDVLKFGVGITAASLKLERSGYDLIFKIGSNGDQVRVSNWYYGAYYQLAKLEFADATVLTNAQISQLSVSQTGTAANDYLYGSASNDLIDGLAGNDNISAGDGNNTVKGGLGDDYITAGVGNDSVDGGDGNDNIQGGAGTNTLQGGIGNDTISGAGTLTGGTGNDVLTGYNGTTDTFIFNVGDGADTISTYESSGIASDVLKFGVGITAASLKLERSGYDLIFKIGSNGDQVRVSNWYYGAYYQLAKLEFADATVLTNAQISQLSVSQTGTAANDYLYGSASNDLIDGLAGNDNISAGDGNNTVKGGLGDDYITAGVGNDSVDGGDGNDNIQGGAGTNTLQGGIGNDTISGAGTLTGGTGNDVLTGYNGTTDTFIFNVGDGADTISTYESSGIASDVLKFGVGITAASLKLERSGYDLIFKIGSNGDQVRVSNWYYGAYYQLAKLEFADATVLTNAQISQLSVSQTGTAANDYLYGSASNDLIDGLEGNDNISAGDGNNTVKGGLGDDYITAGVGNDSVDGGDGNDNIQGGAGTNTLQGGIGNDTISGAGTLTGGTGNDVLTGYNGTTDTFIFNVGDGADTISTYESSGIASDVLKFGVGITAASLKLERSGYDLIFKIGSNGDQVRVSNWYYGAYYQLAKLEFADATVLTNAQISQLSVSQTGTAANDYLYGSASNDLIDGLAGNDNISAGDGNNTVKGGLGDDYITAGVGNDSVDGGDGNDNIQGGAGTNTLQGGIGNDTISGAGTLTGGTGNDVLTGYNGTTDTFIFNVGDGADTISTYESSGIASDVLKFGVGITAASLKLERSGYDLIFKIGSNGDQVRVSNWYYGAYYQLAKLEFADATVLTNAQISQLSVSQTGTAANDYLYGSASNDLIDGLAGNDNISAGDGNNTVKGGLGDDYITAGVGNDSVDGGDGNDNIQGGAGTNTLQGGIGNDTISGAGTLTGGTGNDVLTGYNGTTDTFIFNVGDGADTISTYESSGIASDVLKFGVGITAASLKLERSGYDLIFKIGSNGDQVRVSNWYYGAYYQLAKLEFADATVLTNAQISQLSVSQTGTAANDYLYGSASNDLIDGLEGNDNISAGDGNNTVKGGLGDDYITAGVGNDSVDGGDGNDNIQGGAGTNTLQGGIGNDTISGAGTLTGGTGNDVLTGYNGTTDTFIFNVGDGADTISTYESSGIASDVLKFGVGITAASLKLERSGYDLIFKIGSNGDQVRVSNWYYGAYYQLAKLEFADATVLTNAQISQLSVSQTGTAANDYLYGSASNDLIDGLEGNDNISAGDGNNTVKGGLGDDYITAGVGNDSVDGGDGNDNIQGGAGTNTLQGGIGNDTISGAGTLTGGTGNDVLTGYNGTTDTFIFNVGDGADTISTYESSGIASDVLKFGVGITAASLKLERSGYDLIFKIGSNGDQVRVSNWYYGAYYQLAKLEFADATVLTNAQISQLSVSQTGTAANDYLYGSASNDLIDGLAGNDNISAGDGNNTVKGGLGDDYITAGVGNDSVDGGDGNDNIQGGAGNDILTGSGGKDVLAGGLGSDRFDYRNLTDSLLANFDIITDFNAATDNDLFRVSTPRTAFGNGGAVATLDTAGISAKLTTAFFAANATAQFAFGSRTFVAINDATAGFNASTDAMIEVTNLTGTLGLTNFTTA